MLPGRDGEADRMSLRLAKSDESHPLLAATFNGAVLTLFQSRDRKGDGFYPNATQDFQRSGSRVVSEPRPSGSGPRVVTRGLSSERSSRFSPSNSARPAQSEVLGRAGQALVERPQAAFRQQRRGQQVYIDPAQSSSP